MKVRASIKTPKDKPTVKQLDALVREVVRLRDKRCRVCGSGAPGLRYLQAAHFITRSNYAVRFDLDNVYLLCSGCHMMRRNSWHKDPASAVEFVRKALGKAGYQALRMRAAVIGQKIDKWAVKAYLEQELRKLKGG